MIQGKCSLIAVVLLLPSVCLAVPPAGDAPVYTAAGDAIVFQCPLGDFLGLARTDGSFDKVETVLAADRVSYGQPAVGPDGSLAFIGISRAETAHQKGKSKSEDGANVYLLKEGKVRRLTWGRQFESTPSFGPDGKVYYSSADLSTMRGVPCLCRIDPAQERPKPEVLYVAPAYHSTGVSQPVVSPDGRFLAWAELDGSDDTWAIRISRLEDRMSACTLTPAKMWAYAPRWCADSRHLVFTGFRPGDPGWCVYMLDVKTGGLNRLFAGTEPCVSPDGRTVAYVKDGVLATAPFVLPEEDLSSVNVVHAWEETEKVLLSREGVPNGTAIDLGDEYAFGRDKTAFVRVVFAYDGDDSCLQSLVRLAYGESAMGLHLYLGKGQPHFATRDGLNAHFRIATGTKFRAKQGVMTGIRTAEGLYLLVEGDRSFSAVYQKRFSRDNISLARPEKMVVGENMPTATRVMKIEVGTGWPTNVPKPLDVRELFK